MEIDDPGPEERGPGDVQELIKVEEEQPTELEVLSIPSLSDLTLDKGPALKFKEMPAGHYFRNLSEVKSGGRGGYLTGALDIDSELMNGTLSVALTVRAAPSCTYKEHPGRLYPPLLRGNRRDATAEPETALSEVKLKIKNKKIRWNFDETLPLEFLHEAG